MVVKSYGKKRGTRQKLRLKEVITLSNYLEKFSEGEKVHIKLSKNKNLPHPRFHGRTGTIISERGRAYVVEIKDKASTKHIIVRSEHLRKA